MEKIFVIITKRFYDEDHHEGTIEINRFFKTEEEAKNWLESKYGEWLDKEHLYIYYGGLGRFRKSNERGISFAIQPLKAA